LRTLRPALDPRPYVFCLVEEAGLPPLAGLALGIFREAEGVTLMIGQRQADAAGLAYGPLWALITLTVHSDLAAVGFLAAITARLAGAGLAVNPVSAYHHDHLFVPWERREQAMALLQKFEED
jgi:hypothetical protein